MLSEMDQLPQCQSKFLCIPAEIRAIIIKLSIGEHTFHISATGNRISSTRCGFERVNSSSSPARRCYDCRSTALPRLPALTGVCRVLYHEANDILYRQTVLSFSTSQSLCTFFASRPLALRSARLVDLKCGPAKHASQTLKLQHRSAIAVLVHQAPSLVEVHFQYGIYYGIRCDKHLFSNFWYHNLCRASRIARFLVCIDLNLDLPGPIGNVVESYSAQQQLETTALCTENALRTLHGTSSKHRGCISKTEVRWLQEVAASSAIRDACSERNGSLFQTPKDS